VYFFKLYFLIITNEKAIAIIKNSITKLSIGSPTGGPPFGGNGLGGLFCGSLANNTFENTNAINIKNFFILFYNGVKINKNSSKKNFICGFYNI
jgi:hypothetical protein